MRYALGLTFLLLLAPPVTSFKAQAQQPPKPHPFEKDIAAFEAADKVTPPPQHAILFVGDSTFTRWKTIREDLPGYTVINRGFGGSKMSDLLYFTDRVVLPYKPRLIVVQEGGNDIHGGRTPEQFLADTQAFVEKVQSALPDVPIILCCITPNSARWNEMPRRKIANKLVQDYVATKKNVRFIDWADAFLGPDGKPRDELYVADRMHPSPAGYKLRVKLLLPYLGEPDVKVDPQTK